MTVAAAIPQPLLRPQSWGMLGLSHTWLQSQSSIKNFFCQNCGYECHCHENEFAGAECGDEWGSSMLKCENDVAVAVMRMNALAQNDSTAHAPNPQIAPLQPEQQRLEGSFDEGFAERFCQKCGYECHCYVNEFAGTECGDEWGTRCPASRRCW